MREKNIIIIRIKNLFLHSRQEKFLDTEQFNAKSKDSIFSAVKNI